MLFVIDAEKEIDLDGKWSNWSSWSKCSVTCGGKIGVHHRQRICKGVSLRSCFGPDQQMKECLSEMMCPKAFGE